MKDKKKLIVSIVGIVALLLIVIGVTYAAFNYTGVGNSVNRVTTGTVTMAYKEGNGHISITNALPTSDEVGKALTNTGVGDNNVFDFTVEVHITGTQNISYEVTAEKILTGENATTLNDNDVKLYLQKGTVNGTYDEEVLLPSNFNPLTAQDTFGATTNEMVLDSGVLNTTTTYYYRLRMWIDENCTLDGVVRKFTVKVNVYGKDGNIPSNNKVNVESVDRKTITEDDSIDLDMPNSSGPVTWTSSDTSVATVDSDGVVTPVGPGTTTVTGTDGTSSESIGITINSVYSFGGSKENAPQGAKYKGIVYLNPIDLTITCNSTNITAGGANASGCMKFYIYDDSGDTYKMILDHNIADETQWHYSGDNVAYELSEVYTSIQGLGWNSSLNTRIITAAEVNTITGKTGFDSTNTSSSYHFNNSSIESSQVKSDYAWLYDYTTDCEEYGCNTSSTLEYAYGYWTSTTVGEAGSGSEVWGVHYEGYLGAIHADIPTNGGCYGIRPVITISKSLFN